MLRRPLKKARYALILYNIGGLKVFLRQLGRQMYNRDVLCGFEKDLNEKVMPVSSKLEYSLRPATEEDMEEVLAKSITESKESAHELIKRKWFYEEGFHDCYIARVAGTSELCHIQWLVSSEADDKAIQGFKNRLPWPKKDEVLIENIYTFEKYRGKGIMPSVTVKLCELARSKGFKRIITYVRQDNVASLRGMKKAGFKQFEEVPELKFLFFTRRNHN